MAWTTYGTPTATAPCIIRGYTAAANDGGIGVVSGNGSLACINSSALDFIKLVDMRFTNCGAAAIITLDVGTLIVNCEFDTTTGSGVVIGNSSVVVNSYFHNIGNIGISSASNILIYGCTFRNETNDFVTAINSGATNFICFNIFDLDGASRGISIANPTAGYVMFNSIYSNAGTGIGIRNSTTTHTELVAINNTVAGFSGAGGIGIQVVGQNANLCGYNLAYNNTTNYDISGDVSVDLGNNDTAGAIPFVDAPGDDFDPTAGLSVGYPTTWKSYTATQQNLLRMAAHYKRVARARSMMGLG